VINQCHVVPSQTLNRSGSGFRYFGGFHLPRHIPCLPEDDLTFCFLDIGIGQPFFFSGLLTMNHLGLLLLGSPLSVWALLASYHGLVSPTASLKSRVFALGLVALTFKINASLLRSYLFTRRARALGCGEVTDLRVKDPILGLDAFFKTVAALNSFRLMPYYNKLFSTIGQTHAQILLGRRVLMTNEPENIKAILATHMDEWPIDGPRLYSMLPLLGPYSIFTSNGQAWHETRALIRPSFVRDQVADFACFDRHIGNLLANIPLDGTTFDMQHLLLKMTMDSSTDFMLGHSTNSLVSSSPEADQFLRDFEYASDVATKRARLGLLLSYFPNKKLDDSVRRLKAYLHFYLKKVVAEKEAGKRDTGSKSYVFLDELLKLDIPEEQIIGHILSVVVAGRDTTAGALSAVFYCLARSPDVVAKLRREIDEVGEEKPSWEQLKQMKYLNNVIREGMWLHFLVPIFLPTSTCPTAGGFLFFF